MTSVKNGILFIVLFESILISDQKASNFILVVFAIVFTGKYACKAFVFFLIETTFFDLLFIFLKENNLYAIKSTIEAIAIQRILFQRKCPEKDTK